jgi:hypothetical protein
MAKAQPQPLPSRYRPYLAQSRTETAIRYGSQESALHQIFDQTTRDYYRQATAQRDAGMSVLGALKGADKGLRDVYAQSGLGPHLLSQIADSPTGQRLAGELASNRVDVKNQLLGAQAGQQYIQQHLGDQYREDVGNINAQGTALAKEKGLFQADLLDQLITADKAARHAARLAAAKQRHDDALARRQIVAAQTNALIGQGLLPNADGSLVPLPGGKADPNAPQFQDDPKRPTRGPGSASPAAQLSASTAFSNAVSLAKGLLNGLPITPENVTGAASILANGRPASSGQPTYRDVKDASGHTKRIKVIDDHGHPVMTPARPKIPSFDQPIAQAAAEQAAFGYVTSGTLGKLRKLGYSVRQFLGLVTEHHHRATTPRNNAPLQLPKQPHGVAPTRDQQPG